MNLPSPIFISTSLVFLFSAACSDPPSPPAQGAVTELVGPNQTTNGCNASGPEFTAPPNTDPQSGTTASLNCDVSAGNGCSADSNIVVDGDGNSHVECSVSGGPPYTVRGTLSQGNVQFNISGTLSSTGGKAFVSSSNGGFNLQDAQCDIFVENNKGQIKSGAIWARFDCQNFGDPTNGGSAPGCDASGKFIFENCDK